MERTLIIDKQGRKMFVRCGSGSVEVVRRNVQIAKAYRRYVPSLGSNVGTRSEYVSLV